MKISKRPQFYILFIDLRRAFDSVPRQILLKKIIEKGTSERLTNFLIDYLQDTKMVVDGVEIDTNIGVP